MLMRKTQQQGATWYSSEPLGICGPSRPSKKLCFWFPTGTRFVFGAKIIGFIAFFVLAILAPLLMFTPQMARAKRKGLADYGLLAQRYVQSFDEKWVRNPGSGEDLLGAADIQSLADLGNSYALVREMRPVPFGLDDMTRLAIATAVPFLPLLLTVFSLEELIMRLIKVLF